MPHRVSIIGQSNTIRARGFVRQLETISGIEIGHTGRIGATPSILLPFFAGDVFLAGHGFLVIDVAVIDQLFLWESALDPAMIATYIAYAIHHAHMVGCVPIVLILPHQASLPPPGDRTLPMLHQLYRQVARHNGALCLDMLPWLLDLRARDPATFATAFDDPNHVSEEVSRAAACLLAEMFDAVAAAGPPRRMRIVALPQFGRLPLAEVPHALPEVEHRNSVLSETYLRFGPGDVLVVPTRPFERVHGLLINRSASDGVLEIAGTGRVAKMLGTRSERDIPYVAQIVPLLGAVRDADRRLTLRMLPRDEAPTESSWNASPGRGEQAEVSGLLLEYQPALFHVEQPMIGELFERFCP